VRIQGGASGRRQHSCWVIKNGNATGDLSELPHSRQQNRASNLKPNAVRVQDIESRGIFPIQTIDPRSRCCCGWSIYLCGCSSVLVCADLTLPSSRFFACNCSIPLLFFFTFLYSIKSQSKRGPLLLAKIGHSALACHPCIHRVCTYWSTLASHVPFIPCWRWWVSVLCTPTGIIIHKKLRDSHLLEGISSHNFLQTIMHPRVQDPTDCICLRERTLKFFTDIIVSAFDRSSNSSNNRERNL